MIPKLLHQTYKTADIPKKWQGYQEILQSLHPGWTYRLWTDEENLKFVQAEFPDVHDIYVKLPKNIMRADMIRYLLLHKLGGVYMDLDYEMLKPFDLLQEGAVLPWEVDGQRVANSIMASSPGHPFFKRVIDELKANPPLAADADVEASTGPGMLSRVLLKCLAEGMPICTPTRLLFNPTTPHSPRQYRAIVKGGESYGIHHTHGSWREISFPRRVRNRTVNVIKWLFT